jgi:hypothetical protein
VGSDIGSGNRVGGSGYYCAYRRSFAQFTQVASSARWPWHMDMPLAATECFYSAGQTIWLALN